LRVFSRSWLETCLEGGSPPETLRRCSTFWRYGVKAVTTSVVLHTYKLNGKEVFE
jgi:hypothetical protein